MAGKTADEILESISKHLESLHGKHDATNVKLDALSGKHDELSKRMDAMEETEKERADKARKDAALPTNPAHEERDRADVANPHVFADAQMKADSVYQAWGKQAPHALQGESVRLFRERLLNPLKIHSIYKDSNLSDIADEMAFSNVERVILDAALAASNTPAAAGAPLRKVTTTNEMGHRITKFFGDPMVCWAPFAGGGVRFGRINRHPGA